MACLAQDKGNGSYSMEIQTTGSDSDPIILAAVFFQEDSVKKIYAAEVIVNDDNKNGVIADKETGIIKTSLKPGKYRITTYEGINHRENKTQKR
jgi:hypothetical protein